MNKEPEFWGMEKDAYMTWTSVEERMEDYLEMCVLDEIEPEKTVTLIGYVRDTINITRIAKHALQDTLEWLDDEYTLDVVSNEELLKDVELLEAAKEFVKKIVGKYRVETLERVCEKVVNVNDYGDKGEFPMPKFIW